MFRYTIAGFITIASIILITFISAENNEGETLYAEYCATCHGADLGGGNSSSLIDGKWEFGSSRDAIMENIVYGIEDYGMPGFEASLTEEQAYAIVDFMAERERQKDAVVNKVDKVLETLDYKLGLDIWVDDLEVPWALDFTASNRALVTQQSGELFQVVDGKKLEKAVKNTPEVIYQGQGGLMDVAIDPEYNENGWIYLSYSHLLEPGKRRSPAMTRIVRGRITENVWTDQQVVYQAEPEHYFTTRHHYGCRIVFDKEGYLYFSVGDRGRRQLAQDISLPNGKTHRIHRDGSIPEDNPFLDKEDAVPTIYSYGNRNAQGLAIHPVTDELWETEHGPMGGDELNIIRSGINYGWPVISYGKNYDGTIITELTEKEGMEQPVMHWTPSIAVCGLDFYRGDLFPKWNNRLMVGALKYEEVRLLSLEEDRVVHQEVIFKDHGRVRDVTSGPDGAIYVVLNEPDRIVRLTPIGK